MAGLNKLYQAIENKLGTKYSVTYESLKEDVEYGADNICGIFLYIGQNDEYDFDGCMYEVVKAHIQVHTDGSIEKTDDAIGYLRDFVDKIENEKSEVAEVKFISCRHIGAKALPTGYNSYNTQVCVSNIEIFYKITE